jgi:outer membrane protein assembly factor BamB
VLKKKMKNPIFSILFGALAFSIGVCGQATALQNNSSRDNLYDGTGNARYYSINVPPGYGRLVVQTASSDVGDCDVYLRLGALPTTSNYDTASESPGNNEMAIVKNPTSGTWYIMLYAYSGYFSLHFEVLYDGTTGTDVSVGNKLWDVSLDGSMVSSPCLSPDGTVYAATEAGSLWAIANDGTAKWHKFVGNVSATPALSSDGSVYIVNEDGKLMALSSTGVTKWTFGGIVHGSHPVAISTDGTIYVPSNGNALFAITPDGVRTWQFLVESGFSASAPAIIGSDGTIYGSFYHPNLSLGRLLAIRPDGTEKWRFDFSGKINSPSINAAGSIVFGSPQPVNKVYAIQSNGTKLWESSVTSGSFYSESYVFSTPVFATDGTIYISSNRRLLSLSPADGREKWHYDSDVLLVEFDRANGPTVDSNGTIYFGSLGDFGAGNFYAVNPNGTLVWKYDVGGEVACPAVVTTNAVIFGTANGSRKVFALKTAGNPSASVWPVSRQNASNTGSLEPAKLLDRPKLTITKNANDLHFIWQETPGFVLESAQTVNSSAWTPVPGSPIVLRGQSTLTISLLGGTHFYRLRRP